MSTNYRPEIDGLRAIAVLSVIIFHLNNNWLPGGFIGVDIFFVISGYLITRIIFIDISNKKFSFKNFYQRRINRILPVFFIVMLFTTITSWYILVPDDFIFFLRSLKSTTYLSENMFFAQNTGGYFDLSADKMPILHTWSLAVEEQFYILLPFLLLLFYKFKINKKSILITLIFIAFISFILAQLSPYSNFLNKYNYYSLFTGRAGELLIGSIIGIISVNKEDLSNKNNSISKNLLTIIGFILFLTSIFLLSKKNLFPSFWAIIPTIGVGLILYFKDDKLLINKLLSSKPIVYIGTLSYSLYLWHWPIIVLLKEYLNINSFSNFKQYLFIIVLTFILSLFSFYFIEKPCRKHIRSFKFSFISYYFIPVLLILSLFYFQKETRFLDSLLPNRFDKYNVSQYNEKSKYILGKDDFLFLGNEYVNTLDKLTLSKKPSKDNIESEYQIFKNITDNASLYKTKVALIIGADKARVYSDYLPNEIIPSKERYIDFYLNLLKKNKNLIIYDSGKDLTKVAKNEQALLYSRTDTHWNLKGSYVAYSNLMKLFNITPDKVNFKSIPSIPGDLIYISQLKDFKLHNDDNFEVSFNRNFSIKYETKGLENENFGKIENSFNNNPLVDKNIWVIGDSFNKALREYLNATFKEVHYLGHWEDKLSTLPSELNNNKIKPDYIFIIKVERSYE